MGSLALRSKFDPFAAPSATDGLVTLRGLMKEFKLAACRGQPTQLQPRLADAQLSTSNLQRILRVFFFFEQAGKFVIGFRVLTATGILGHGGNWSLSGKS